MAEIIMHGRPDVALVGNAAHYGPVQFFPSPWQMSVEFIPLQQS